LAVEREKKKLLGQMDGYCPVFSVDQVVVHLRVIADLVRLEITAQDAEALVSQPQKLLEAVAGESEFVLPTVSVAGARNDVDEFIDRLWDISYEWQQDQRGTRWLSSKPDEWHQQLYALLYEALGPSDEFQLLGWSKIVRLSDGSYSVGEQCFFPTETVIHDELLPRVAAAVYSSGQSKHQQEAARKFLVALGVREVGESEQVQAILQRRYENNSKRPDEKTHLEDLKRFIALVEKEPSTSRLFAGSYIFKCSADKWRMPREIFLDDPYLSTGLRLYYQELGNEIPSELTKHYALSAISSDQLARFAQLIGAQCKLNIQRQSAFEHPAKKDLVSDYYRSTRTSDNEINEDWVLIGLCDVLRKPSLDISLLVWRTLTNADPKVLKARYRPNAKFEPKEQPSSLVLTLQQYAWVPQVDGGFVLPSQARAALLPPGFPFDSGGAWLNAIHFGEDEQKVTAEYQEREVAEKKLGFPDADSLARAQKIASLPKEDQDRIQEFVLELERRRETMFPEHEPRNPDRRDKKVRELAGNAPERVFQQRIRSVSVGREEVKSEAEQYLRSQYTNCDGDLVCQICKEPMPFRLDDGSYFFVMVELVTSLDRHHFQNYAALCPNHAAIFLYANGSKDTIRDLILQAKSTEVNIVLAQKSMTICFTNTHIADLRSILRVENQTSK
jgi:hypothetical protein